MEKQKENRKGESTRSEEKKNREKHEIPGVAVEEVIAYGGSSEVRRGKTESGAECAIKIIRADTAERYNEAKREGAIQRIMQHRHIVKLQKTHVSKPYMYLVLDYAEKRELFGYIEPGSGIAEELCRLYLGQLYSALSYMHTRGVCHRDIKPENILLDRSYNLLIADFGSATVYRTAEERRALRRRCGSLGYMAPEVHCGEYDGEGADMWSFGIVALVMMTGISPWGQARLGDSSFERYKTTTVRDFSPFNLLCKDKLEMIEKMLAVEPAKRIRMKQVQGLAWMRKKSAYAGPDGLVRSAELVAMRLAPPVQPAFSQPGACVSPFGREFSSQPVFMSYDGLPTATRISARVSAGAAVETLIKALEEVLIQYKKSENTVSFTTVDSSKNMITGDVLAKEVAGGSVLVFQRRRGNCIEFKKMFNAVRDKFAEIAEMGVAEGK